MSIRSPMQRLAGWRIPVALFFCLSLALTPSLADARAGSFERRQVVLLRDGQPRLTHL